MQPPASVYSKNFQSLLNRFPDLARRIDAAPLPEAGAFALAKSGDLILTHNGTHLLSSYNPRRQADSLLRSRIAQRFPHSLPAPDCLSFLCLGLSLGYLPLGDRKSVV